MCVCVCVFTVLMCIRVERAYSERILSLSSHFFRARNGCVPCETKLKHANGEVHSLVGPRVL